MMKKLAIALMMVATLVLGGSGGVLAELPAPTEVEVDTLHCYPRNGGYGYGCYNVVHPGDDYVVLWSFMYYVYEYSPWDGWHWVPRYADLDMTCVYWDVRPPEAASAGEAAYRHSVSAEGVSWAPFAQMVAPQDATDIYLVVYGRSGDDEYWGEPYHIPLDLRVHSATIPLVLN